jgi:DNA-binding response OmpR family regulator
MARILLVDDDVNICNVAQLSLEHEGHHVTIAYDGKEGMEKAFAGNFDLIITDLMMPKMDGLMMLTRLRRAHIEVPALLSTSLSEENIIIFPPKPYQAYLGKPYIMNELVTSVDKLLHTN